MLLHFFFAEKIAHPLKAIFLKRSKRTLLNSKSVTPKIERNLEIINLPIMLKVIKYAINLYKLFQPFQRILILVFKCIYSLHT